MICLLFVSFVSVFVCLFERERERKGGGETSYQLPLICTPTQDPTHNLAMFPDEEIEPRHFQCSG